MNNMTLQCDSLVKRFDDGADDLLILSNINLSINAGQRVAIVGSSGSGKTTLLNILGALDKPTSGSINILGRNLSECSESQLEKLRNETLGFVYQFHHLLSEFTALENVAMPLLMRAKISTNEIQDKAEAILDRVGLKHRLSHKPGELSGGERQRVAIARALVGGPKLVFMDEPTGNLDTYTAQEVHQLVLDLSRQLNTSFVVVTHDMHLASKMDSIYQLKQGHLSVMEAN